MTGQPTIINEEGLTSGEKGKAPPSPYTNARRAWNDHVGSVLTATRTWQIVTLLLSLITLAAVGGLGYIGSQSRFIPYIVEVDKLGQAVAIQPAEQAASGDPRVVRAMVANFISDARMVTPDGDLQKKAIERIYGLLQLHDPARQKMNEWFSASKDSSPFERAQKVIVSVEIGSVLQQSPTSWQVDWVETTRDREGAMQGQPARMRAIVTVYIVPPSQQTSESQIRSNPIGMFVKDFSWSRTN
jgi:type IV secretory pathway TrbF-like protein